MTLINWYKGSTPIYYLSIGEGRPLTDAQLHPVIDMKTRLHFNMDTDPPTLILNPVYAEDDGTYLCRGVSRRNVFDAQLVKLDVIGKSHTKYCNLFIIIDELSGRTC